MQILWDLIIWRLFKWYIERLVCIHFCRFRQAGSTLKYTHVHILRPNPQGATGLGHDDETANESPGHVTISTRDGCTIQAEDESSMQLRDYESSLTAYFIPSNADGSCERGFVRIRCRCRNQAGEAEDVWVCYTFDHALWERWYKEQSWTHRTGRFELRAERASDIPANGRQLPCPASIILESFTIRVVSSCTGFGAGDGNNSCVTEARDELRTAANRITCAAPCTAAPVATETFVGWKCGRDSGGFLLAEARVQWRIECVH